MSTTFDKLLELKSASPVTFSQDETLIAFDAVRMGDRVSVIINVTAVSGSGTTPTLTPYINVSPTVGGTKTKIAQLPAISAIGRYEIPLSGIMAKQFVAGAAAIGVGWTVGGTTPSFTCEAYLAFEG